MAETNFYVFGIRNFDGSFQLRFHANFGFSQTIYWETKLKTNKHTKNNSHYLQMYSEKNKSHFRPSLTQREQILSSDATMHDFSK